MGPPTCFLLLIKISSFWKSSFFKRHNTCSYIWNGEIRLNLFGKVAFQMLLWNVSLFKPDTQAPYCLLETQPLLNSCKTRVILHHLIYLSRLVSTPESLEWRQLQVLLDEWLHLLNAFALLTLTCFPCKSLFSTQTSIYLLHLQVSGWNSYFGPSLWNLFSSARSLLRHEEICN